MNAPRRQTIEPARLDKTGRPHLAHEAGNMIGPPMGSPK